MSSGKKKKTNKNANKDKINNTTKKKNLEEEVEKVLETIDSTEIDNKEEKEEKKEKEEIIKEDAPKQEEIEDKKKEKKNFDLTTRIRIDRARLNDTGTLDTSFLEGRKKPVSKKDIIVEEKLLTKNNDEKKPHKILKGFFLLLISVLIGFLSYYISAFYIDKPKPKTKIKVETKEIEKVIVDENIVFLGDQITEDYDLNEYFEDYFTVNSGKKDDTTKDILDNLDERVYRFNPSKVFILIGTNDLVEDISNDDIVDNIKEIVKSIQGDRPYAKIYLESIYPINDSDDEKIDSDVIDIRKNKEIRKINESLEEMAEELEITYIDLYSLLLEEDNLNIDYTTDGLNISEEGYKKITTELLKYVEEKEEKK